jgi:AcrR family transcriptional regulator
MAELACEQGVQSVTVAQIVSRAQVSTRTFNSLFESRDGCLQAAFEDTVALATDRVRTAYDRDGPWADRVRAGLLALLRFFDQRPDRARLCVIQVPAAGPLMMSRCREVVSALVQAIDQGGRGAARGRVPSWRASSSVGEVLGTIHAQLLQGDAVRLTEMADRLTSMIVVPYLGEDAPSEEFSRLTPMDPGQVPGSSRKGGRASPAPGAPPRTLGP